MASEVDNTGWSPHSKVKMKPNSLQPCGTEGKSVQFESSWPLEEIFVPYGEEKEGSMVTGIQNRIPLKSQCIRRGVG